MTTLLIAAAAVVLLGAIGIVIVHRALCPHNSGLIETHKYDAICKSCGKNLGFIDALNNNEC